MATTKEHVVLAEFAAPAAAPNLDNNVEARISNPLTGIPTEKLLANAAMFANSNGLSHAASNIKKGALVAQNPTDFENLDLEEDEKQALRIEITKRWRHPFPLYLTIVVCSIGACTQGWDQTGSNGANLSFPQEFGIGAGFLPPGPNNPNHNRDNWLVGLVNAAPYIASALVGCWISDPLNKFFGRRGAIFISAIILILTPIGSGLSQTWEQLFACRLLMGLGMGLKASTSPVFAAENAPAAIRGALVMTWSMWTAFGIFLGFCANLAVANVGPITWRLQLGSAFIPAVPLAAGIYFCPESPRWFIKKRRYQDAYKSLLLLRSHPILAARDLYYINAQVQLEQELVGETNIITRACELFTVPRLRRSSMAAFVVNIGQQMCGINIMAFYSSTIFLQAGASTRNALVVSLGFGITNFVFNWAGFFTIDTFGRRSLLLLTFPQMAWTLLAAGFCFYIPQDNPAHLGMIAFFVFIFVAIFSPGGGPVPFVYTAEAFPLSHREVGMGFGVATNLFFAAALSITFPRMLAAFGATGAFCFYAGMNVCAFLMIFFFVPETKQRTLEELDYVFAISSGKFIRYQTGTWLPWFIKRYVFFRKEVELKPLYDFDSGVKKDLRDVKDLVV